MTLKLAALALMLAGISTVAVAGHHEDGEKHKHGGMMKMFKKMDTDGDGMVSRAEFDAKNDAKFKKMDADSDGKVSMEEKKAYMKSMKEKMKKHMDKDEM